ncbi:hypothetical protein E1262_12900 [Jiangella aurantiaca]|uniref:Uncharacterized protein n=1 Tax=Jiangella aurantiaca TaxID=2530373 RepID=A0A4R5AHI0_9ACTN|nr:hypothetical protein [Jiangella aurantiaca]TDD69532.1 hypothetical protein E1262_12900 [Jiangella aurantiaca]
MSEPAAEQTIRPEPQLLGIYLNDHLAGATAGVQLVRRLARSMRGTPLGEPLSGLAEEIAADREELVAIMDELDVPIRRYKLYTAAAAELAGRLKFNGHLLTRSPLSAVVELEMLRLGIEGKASGWRTLRTVGVAHGRPDVGRMDRLIERATEQAAQVETLRVRAAARVFGTVT